MYTLHTSELNEVKGAMLTQQTYLIRNKKHHVNMGNVQYVLNPEMHTAQCVIVQKKHHIKISEVGPAVA